MINVQSCFQVLLYTKVLLVTTVLLRFMEFVTNVGKLYIIILPITIYLFKTTFSCSNCSDFDLCEICEEKSGIHDIQHVFVKLRYPAPGIGRRHGEMVPIFKKFVYKSDCEKRKKEKELRRAAKEVEKKRRRSLKESRQALKSQEKQRKKREKVQKQQTKEELQDVKSVTHLM